MLREAAVEEGEGGSGTRKGFKKHVFKVRIRGKQRQRCEEREETEFSQSKRGNGICGFRVEKARS